MASGDTALWLHNKLGSTDDLWSGKTICSLLSREKLCSIQRCFHSLQPHVKVKLMLSFLHLARRNVEEWQTDLEEILMMAINDSDQWVSMVGEILRPFPQTGALKLDLEDSCGAFAEIQADLKKVVRKSADNRMLPLECQFLNKTALMAVAGQQPQMVKHFALKRKPKSATLRAELLQKSTEVANNKKNNAPSSVPLKVRSFAKKMEEPDTVPLKGLQNKNTSTSGGIGFLPASAGLSRLNSLGNSTLGHRSTSLRKGGIKLLEINEQPVGSKEAKRRKKQAEHEAMEQQKKEKETVAASTTVTPSVTTTTYTPDYAAGLVTTALAKLPTPVGGTSTSSLPTPTLTYIPATTSRLPTVTAGTTVLSATTSSAATQQARENLQLQLQQQLGQSQIRTHALLTPSTIPSQTLVIQNQTSGQLASSQQILQPVIQSSVPQQKKGLSLTKEQMIEAQEMFKTSNRVTRPEKALILGFMAGCRENPCPQQGDVISVRLSENNELVQQADATQKNMIVETFFHMNYSTGEWKRVKKVHDVES